MIGEIIDVITKECKAIPDYQVGTIMLKTDFSLKDIGSYDMPMILIDWIDAGDSGQLIGGLTRMDYVLALNSYNREPDALGDDGSGYPSNLLNVIDVTRRHFSRGNTANIIKPTGVLTVGNNYMVIAGAITYKGQVLQPGTSFTAVIGFTNYTTTAGGLVGNDVWLTYGMWQLLVDYGFRFTLGSLHAADALEGDGLVMGYGVVFETISFDRVTGNTQPSNGGITTINQVRNPPY